MARKFRPIPGFDGYFAGSDGHIYSHWRRGARLKSRIDLSCLPKRLCETPTTTSQYLKVHLRTTDGRIVNRTVHTLVCVAFHGLRPTGFQCSHLNGRHHDNRACNLTWESLGDNRRRRIDHGTDDGGIRNSRAKIKDLDTLRRMRNLARSGRITQEEIGKLFNVSRVFVAKVKCGYRYSRS